MRFNYNLSTWKQDQLERGGDSGLQRRPEPVGEGPADFLRADQVQLRRLRPLGRRKGERIEPGFVHA